MISIIGEVEGHDILGSSTKATKYEHILPELARIEDNKEVDGLLILLNTMGGDVEAGLAIAEMISRALCNDSAVRSLFRKMGAKEIIEDGRIDMNQ